MPPADANVGPASINSAMDVFVVKVPALDVRLFHISGLAAAKATA